MTTTTWVRSERGQALVELALVTPILLALVVAAFEFGRAWNQQQAITDAVREGARNCAVANANSAMAADTVQKTVNQALTNARIAVPTGQPVVTGFRTGTGKTCSVSLTVPYRFVFLGPIMKMTSGQSNVNLSSVFTMRNE